MAVLGIAIGMLVFFVGLSAIFSSPPPSAKDSGNTKYASIAAKQMLAAVIEPGIPPADILDSLVLPKEVASLGIIHTGGGGPGNFDAAIKLQSAQSQGWLYAFARDELSRRGWKVFSHGGISGKRVEVLARRTGGDGFTWQVGIDVSPTKFVTNGDATVRQSTQFMLRLYQLGSGA